MHDKGGPGSVCRLGNCRAIIISGNKFTCQLVRTVLPAIGINNIEVSNEPGDAEQRLTVWRFDLIIVDAGAAAGFDWLALLEMVRTLPDKGQAETPAILLVSGPTKEQIARARQAQVKHVVAKPFAAGALISHVKAALGVADYACSPSRAFIAGPKRAPDLLV